MTLSRYSISFTILTLAFSCGALKNSHAQDASSTIFGSCNIVQQNITVPSGSTIINHLDCVPQRVEDSFSLRYLWLDQTTSSLMLEGIFDPSLKQLMGSAQIIHKNAVYHSLRGLVTRFGNSRLTSRIFEPGNNGYAIMGAQGQVPIATGFDNRSLPKSVKVYAGSEPILLPDIAALKTIMTTQTWPQNYRMTYQPRNFTDTLRGLDAEREAIHCALLYRSVSKAEMDRYWDDLETLNRYTQTTKLRGDTSSTKSSIWSPVNVADSNVRNKAVDAHAYFGAKGWPDDFLLAFSNIVAGDDTCGGYNVEFFALPRKLFTLVAVIEATKGNLEVQGFGFRVDKDEAPRKLRAGVAEERSPPGAVTLNQGQALIVPLRLELRYDLEEDLLRYVTGTAEESGQIFNAIRKLPSDVLRFQGYEYFPSGRAQLREIFSKRKDEFRRPETSRITQTYVVGPAYELIDLALKGQRIPVRRAPASAVAYLGTAGIGSCPFLFFDQGESIIAVGRVLVGAHNKTLTKTEEVLIPDGARFAYISEQEPELTHLERVGVRTMGLEKVLAEYISIGPGRAWRIEIPEGFRTNGTLFIRGYYHPLRELVSIDSP